MSLLPLTICLKIYLERFNLLSWEAAVRKCLEKPYSENVQKPRRKTHVNSPTLAK